MWQKCPICNGTGSIYYPLSDRTSAVCTTCNGHKINDITGLPPNTNNPLVIISSCNTFTTTIPKTFTGDFRDDMCNERK